MPFRFRRLALPELLLIEPKRYPDARGWFMEQFKRTEFAAAGIVDTFVQDNVSYSVRGVLRGLHYQAAPSAQAKLVTTLEGEVFDVAVDVRPDSDRYGQWTGVWLRADRGTALYIPTGFAHGFLVTSHDALVLYKCSAEYNPECERGIRWDDPVIAIRWPISDPIVSEKDRQFRPLGTTPREAKT